MIDDKYKTDENSETELDNKITENSNDDLFSSIRDCNISVVPRRVNERAIELSQSV